MIQPVQPDIESENKETVIDLTQSDFNRLLNSDRVQLMRQKLESLKQRIIHLKKVQSRWDIFGSTVRITSMTVSFILTVANAVINVMPESVGSNTVIRGITAGFSAFIAFTMVASEGTLIAYVRRVLNKYNKEINDIQGKIDRSYLYYEKSRSDGIISDEELTQFFNIIKSSSISSSINYSINGNINDSFNAKV